MNTQTTNITQVGETNQYAVQFTESLGDNGGTKSYVDGPFAEYQTAFDYGKEKVDGLQDGKFQVHKLVPVMHATDEEFDALAKSTIYDPIANRHVPACVFRAF